MTERKLSGGGRKSLADLKREIARKKASGGAWIKAIPRDQTLVVRFLNDPDQWFGYEEYYNQRLRSYVPLLEGEFVEDEDSERASKRYVVAAVDVAEGQLLNLKMPVSVVDDMVRWAEKRGTVTDRNWELERTGVGLDTKYSADPLDPEPFDTSAFEPADPEELLMEVRKTSGIDDDEPASTHTEPTARRQRRRLVVDE